jgi:hypothetical protein
MRDERGSRESEVRTEERGDCMTSISAHSSQGLIASVNMLQLAAALVWVYRSTPPPSPSPATPVFCSPYISFRQPLNLSQDSRPAKNVCKYENTCTFEHTPLLMSRISAGIFMHTHSRVIAQIKQMHLLNGIDPAPP